MNDHGQALLETVGAMVLVVPLAAACVRMAWSEWIQVQCIHHGFEAALASALGENPKPLKRGGHEPEVASVSNGYRSRSDCGGKVYELWIEDLH
jgi:hypothetical protein